MKHVMMAASTSCSSMLTAIVNDFPTPSAQEVNSTGVGVVPAICVD